MTLDVSHVLDFIALIETVFKSNFVRPSPQTFPCTEGPINLFKCFVAYSDQDLLRDSSFSFTEIRCMS